MYQHHVAGRAQLADAHGATSSDAIEAGTTTHLISPPVGRRKPARVKQVMCVCVCVCVCMCVLCCVCVAGGSDPPRGTTQAISIGIPVVSDKFVLDCANREGLGLKLRQRTHLRDSE